MLYEYNESFVVALEWSLILGAVERRFDDPWAVPCRASRLVAKLSLQAIG